MLIGTLEDWRQAYAQGARPADLLAQQRLACDEGDPAWISLAGPEQLQAQIEALAALEKASGRERLPLYGVPFAVKDNIDVASFRTTAACEAFAYVAQEDAFVIKRLKNAGAIVLGKTNLDQFATGLVGTRSPYGIVPNTFDSELICGGSSSGSASVVARGLVPFALSTDTAGSGRVPAGFNQIVGLKPTPGAVSGTGLVPACRTLDCIGVLACTVADSARVMSLMEGQDTADSYSRPRPMLAAHKPLSQLRVATPARRKLSASYEAAFSGFSGRLQAQVAQLQEIPFDLLHEVAGLLYHGPWVAERVVGAGRIYAQQPEQMLPVVRSILDVARQFSAADTFSAQYRRCALQQEADRLWQQWDVLCVPTAPRHPRIDEVMADPIAVNSELGTYTNFVNLLGWSAIAIPACRLPDGLPFGITLIAPGWREPDLVRWAAQLEGQIRLPAGVTGLQAGVPAGVQASAQASAQASTCPWTVAAQGDMVKLAVVGAHLRGMPLNHELLAYGARFVEATQTSADYRLFALQATVPAKPGLARVEGGASIAVEVWEMPLAHFGHFVASVPSPLGIGSVTLISGETVKGFICEGHALNQATDITAFGGWRAYCERLGPDARRSPR